MRFIVATAVVFLVPAAVSTNSTQAPSETKVIVRALTSAGEPVADLKKEEITIRTDGKQREVKSLEMITVSAAAAAAAPATPAPAAAKPSNLPPPFATNAAAAPTGPAGGREFLLLLDEEGLAPGREDPVRTSLGNLISRLSPADRVGVVSLRMGGINMTPSANHASVKEALAKFLGGGTSRESESDLACRTKRSLDTLATAFRDAAPGRTIVLVSSGLAPMSTQQTSDVCQIRPTDLEQLGVSASGSAANLYVLHYPDGLGNQSLSTNAHQGIQNVAGTTNGEFIRITGASDAAATRIPRETSVYYVATLDGAASGPIRRVDGRVARDGVRATMKPVGARAGAAPASAKRMTPREMLATSATFSGLPMRAVGLISRQGASDLKLVTLFEPSDPSVKLTAATVGLLDEKGTTVKSQWSAKPEELQRYPVMAALPVAPGKYRVRVAATTGTSEGAVDYEVVAALQDAAPVKIGGMMLGVSGDKGLAPRLQFSAADKMAVGIAEVYGVSKGATVTVQFEITEDSGQALGSAPGNVQNGPGDDARTIFGGFGIETLAPGDYVMRAIVSVDGNVAGTVSRTLRKVN